MAINKLIVGSLVAAALGAVALPAAARTNVFINFGPPPVYYETVPAPRVGWVWVPGYWDWRYGRYHWVRGHYIRHHRGYWR